VHKHTLLFVAFDGEEEGLKGSRRFIETSPFMPTEVLAVINLECLGVTFPRSWEEGSSESLEKMFIRAGRLNRIDSGPVSITGVKADSIAFLEAGYPAITVQGIHPEDVPFLGTAWDRSRIVRTDILSVTFDALTEFIRELDTLATAPDAANDEKR
jgi:Zn-dependent M28 family amino/carboxypeptidase